MISPGSLVSADTASPRGAFHVKVGAKQWMSFLAMPPILNREIHSAHGVDMTSDKLKMGWIYASLHPAQMVTLKMLWNRAKEELKRKTMGILFSIVRYRIPSVTFPVSSSGPNPTSSFGINYDFVPESLRQLRQPRHTTSISA